MSALKKERTIFTVAGWSLCLTNQGGYYAVDPRGQFRCWAKEIPFDWATPTEFVNAVKTYLRLMK